MKRFLRRSGLTGKQWSLLIVIFIAFVWTLHGAYNMYVRYSQSKDEYERSQAELAALVDRQKELENHIQTLQTSRGVESELRTRFNAAKDGEELVVIVDNKNNTEVANTVATSTSWWQKFKSFFR